MVRNAVGDPAATAGPGAAPQGGRHDRGTRAAGARSDGYRRRSGDAASQTEVVGQYPTKENSVTGPGRVRDGRERRGSARWTRAAGERAMDASGWRARDGRERLGSAMDASGWGARDGRERLGSARWTRAVGKRAMDASSGGSARWNASGARSQERNQEQKQTLFDGKPKGRPDWSGVENSGWFGPRKF